MRVVGMTVSQTLTVAAACSAVFGASFAAGQAILDDPGDTQARPTRSAPPVDSARPSHDSGLELALGHTAGLPGLRAPQRPARESPAPARGLAVPPASVPQAVLPTPQRSARESPAPAPASAVPPPGGPSDDRDRASAPQPVLPTPSAPSPVPQTLPESMPAPRPPSPPRIQTPPVTSPRIRPAAPGP
jgi:hypothetical protein